MFKVGKFYAIQGRDNTGRTVYLKSRIDDASRALKAMATRRRSMSSGSYGSYSSYEDYDSDDMAKVESDSDPFLAQVWPVETPIKTLVNTMRSIRRHAQSVDLNPNSLKIVIVETNVQSYEAESPSDEETELRRFVLEKLSDEEKKLLKVTHWEVYGKLADRTNLDDKDDES